MSQVFDTAQLSCKLHSLAVFRNLLKDDMLDSFVKLLDTLNSEGACETEKTDRYAEFVSQLYMRDGDFGVSLLSLVLESENPVVKARAKGTVPSAAMANSLAEELKLFSAISKITPLELAAAAGTGSLPLFANTAYNFESIYSQRLEEIATKGFGIFASWHMFTLGEGGCLLPVKNPDPQRLAELTGYEKERRKILINTKALLKGMAANNILLYGDAGTGKSSTVKALANEYSDKGLRLVEIRKNQLYLIPGLMDKLAGNPLKFILFIDDLSFPGDDGDFTDLKAILEGNVSARPDNMVVYATSNRRHMLQKRHSDRVGDDLNLNDTLEEQASLAARFGLTITFVKPERDLYLQIVNALAKECGLEMPPQELEIKAEAHAIRYGGRSPRTAKQFVEYCKAEQIMTE